MVYVSEGHSARFRMIEMPAQTMCAGFTSGDPAHMVTNAGIHKHIYIINYISGSFYESGLNIVFLYGRIMVWRPSVCLSVRPSVSHIMSTQYLKKFMSDSHSTK